LYRQATYTAPDLTMAAAKTMAPDPTFDQSATFAGNGSTENQGTASVLYLQEGPTAAGCPTNAAGCKASARAAGSGVFFAFPATAARIAVGSSQSTSPIHRGSPVGRRGVRARGSGGREGSRPTARMSSP